MVARRLLPARNARVLSDAGAFWACPQCIAHGCATVAVVARTCGVRCVCQSRNGCAACVASGVACEHLQGAVGLLSCAGIDGTDTMTMTNDE